MSRETAIEVIKAYRDNLTNSVSNQLDGDIEAFDIAIKALEQESILDKIRAEIIELRSRQNVGVLECLDILDKYKAEIKSSVYEDKAERKTHSLVFDNEHEYQKFKNVLDTGWEPNF